MRFRMACAVLWLGLVAALPAAKPMKWESLMLMKAAAEKGDPEAQFLIGLQYKVGDGLKRDRAEAIKWLRKAAESGHAEAQYALGELYAVSESADVPADPAEAEKWLRKAAEQGNPDALSRLAKDPVKSQAPDQPAQSRQMDEDPAETVRWSLLLSGLRGADAYAVRGLMLENGLAVNRDYVAAAESYRKAAGYGHALAQYRLALMYAEGRGVAKDGEEFRLWLNRAATNGSAEATDLLAKLKVLQEQTEAAAKVGQKHPAETDKK